MATYNEGSTVRLDLAWLDFDGAAALPLSAEYRIDCDSTGLAVRPATALAPGAALVLTPADTAVLGDGSAPEQRRITLVARWGADDQIVREYLYTVRPVRHYPL